jgi:membrane-bound inhibitor of C-type lysozyme
MKICPVKGIGMASATASLIRLFFALAFIGGCATVKQETLTVSTGHRVTYECENGQRVVATYFSVSDGSLDFVKVTLPDGKMRTLPHVVSASGVRYSDDLDLVWWTKGDTAFAQSRNENGEWQITYRACRATPKTD